MRPPRPPGPAPDASTLRNAALRHLARYGSTEVGMVRVLDRRIDRWARAADGDAPTVRAAQTAAQTAAREIAAALVAEGMIDDRAFAETRARRLTRAGRSAAVIGAHLAARGVAAEDRPAAPDAEQELAAALAYARRRRLGPFGEDADGPKALGAMARAGFSQTVARRALAMDADEARDRLLALRAG